MPKSYELKLREAEERRRPRQKSEIYKAVEGTTQKILLGYDHPESLQFELQVTYVEDTFTVDQLHDHVLSEARRLDIEHLRRPLRCNYSKKYIWYDRMLMRPRVQDRELIVQDFAIEPGFRVQPSARFQYESMWGMPITTDPKLQKTEDQMGPCEDPNMLQRLDQGPPVSRVRLFCFTWMGGQASALIPMCQKLPKDWACYALEMPGRGSRKNDEGYPTGEFCVEVMAATLAKEFKKPGVNYVFAHSQGSMFAYYTCKILKQRHNVSPKCFFVSNFSVPAALGSLPLNTLTDRLNLCVNLRIFVGMVKGGWGTDPKLAYQNHMGVKMYQTDGVWESALPVLSDHWITKDFPLKGADEPLDCPIQAFYGKDDTAVSFEQMQEWRGLCPAAYRNDFEVRKMAGGHMWFATSTKRSEELATGLAQVAQRYT